MRAAVVDVGAAHDREVGVLEQLERRLLERALGQDEAQHVSNRSSRRALGSAASREQCDHLERGGRRFLALVPLGAADPVERPGARVSTVSTPNTIGHAGGERARPAARARPRRPRTRSAGCRPGSPRRGTRRRRTVPAAREVLRDERAARRRPGTQRDGDVVVGHALRREACARAPSSSAPGDVLVEPARRRSRRASPSPSTVSAGAAYSPIVALLPAS